MTTTAPLIWLNQAHASQRDIAIQMQADAAARVAVSHSIYREDNFLVADQWFLEPTQIDADPYVEWSLQQAIDRSVSAMVAMRHRGNLVRARERFESIGVRLAAGAMTLEAIDLCEHKDRFYAAMHEAGLPVPVAIPVADAEELEAAIAQVEAMGHGVCVKPVLGVYGRGYWRLERGRPLHDLFSGEVAHTVDTDIFVEAFAKAEAPAPLVVMQHLPGDEFSVDCVVDRGEVVAAVRRRKVSTWQEISTSGIEVDIAREVARRCQLDGLVNVQTRADANGAPNVLEVNTRPSGGVGYAIGAGINLPAAAARMLLGQEVRAPHLRTPVAIRIGEASFVLPSTTESLTREAAA